MRLGLQFGIEFAEAGCILSANLGLGVPGNSLVGATGPHPKRLASTNDNHSQFERIAKGRILVREDETLAKVDCHEFTWQRPATHSTYEVAGASEHRPRVSSNGHSQVESHRTWRNPIGATLPGRHSDRDCVSTNPLEMSGKRELLSHPMIRELRTQGMSYGCKGRALFTGI
jgi:hypothetical protein